MINSRRSTVGCLRWMISLGAWTPGSCSFWASVAFCKSDQAESNSYTHTHTHTHKTQYCLTSCLWLSAPSPLVPTELLCICWGLFSAADESTFGAVVSIWGSRTVCVGLSKNELQCVCVHGDDGTCQSVFLPGPDTVYLQGCCYGNAPEHPSSFLTTTSEETLGSTLKDREKYL